MKEKLFKGFLAAALALVILVGCGLSAAAAAAPASSAQGSADEYDASQAVTLSPKDALTVTKAGVYLLSGSYEGMLVIDAGKDDTVQLVLQNAQLHNENGPAIYVRKAGQVLLTAASGSENTISDGADYTLSDGDTSLDAAVFSKDDLTISGAGKLSIDGNSKHAVVSKDDLAVTATALTVKAANVGLSGKDSVTLDRAAVSVTAGSDGIRADNDTNAELGYVSAVDSTIRIVSGKDGIQAETDFRAENSVIDITAGGGADAKNSDDSESYKGVKAGGSLDISGGTWTLDTLDDAIHANGSLRIAAGDFTVNSGDDAIHADEKAEIAGGTLRLTAREGIEATYVLISDGDITIEATDDGINATRTSAAYTPTVEISGGTLAVTMGPGDTDGIDSNGNLIISGGTISVNASSPFDYDGSGSFTGGTVYVNGQQVSTLSNQMMGGGFGGRGGFGAAPDGQTGFGGGHGGFGGQVPSDGEGGMGVPPDGQGAFPEAPDGGFGGRGHGKRPMQAA